MAAFWGDIVPVSSRAVYDDDDDEDEEAVDSKKPECDMIWNPELSTMGQNKTTVLSEEKLTCRLLIIADGEAASHFVDAALLWQKNSVLAGVLNSGFVQAESQFPPKLTETSKSCTIHRLTNSSSSSSSSSSTHIGLWGFFEALPPSTSSSSSLNDIVIVRNTAHVYPEQLHSWHRQLFSRLNYDSAIFDVVVLTTRNLIHYLHGPASAANSVEPPFMRSLSTGAAKSAAAGAAFERRQLPPLLETPNIVDGVAAQVLTMCEMEGLRAAAFLVYASARLETATIEAFAALLAPGGCLHELVEENPGMKDSAIDFVRKHDAGSMLYT